MRIIYKISLFILMCFGHSLYAQMHDANWLLGFTHSDSIIDNRSMQMVITEEGIDTIFPFPENAPSVNWYSTSMSDSLGNLEYYSNGLHIYNKNHLIMESGDTINPGDWWFKGNSDQNQSYCSLHPGQSILMPGHKRIYILFHQALERNDNKWSGLKFNPLYYSVIDMNRNGGTGKVINKNDVIIEGPIGYLGLTKHGNGRDWWLLVPDAFTNVFYVFLIDPSGIHRIHEITTGPNFNSVSETPTELGNRGFNVFSPNGRYFVTSNNSDYLSIYSFDRCSGYIEHLEHFNYNNNDRIRNIDTGIAFSANSKYLYVNSWEECYQYDMAAIDIFNSRRVVAVYDENFDVLWTFLGLSQLGPDGRIYSAASNNNTVLHYIDRPTIRGIGCNYRQHSVSLPYQNFLTIPRFPNYRLGPLINSKCDSLSFSPGSNVENNLVGNIMNFKAFKSKSSHMVDPAKKGNVDTTRIILKKESYFQYEK